MRVIAGSRRSIPLATLPGKDVRPTTDRIKETLFNMIGSRVNDTRFLDVFAGSGQIGIEALSRGAVFAAFVDANRRAVSCIRDNLKKTRFLDDAKVMACDAKRAFSTLSSGEPYDIIFMDPPYQMPGQEALLKMIVEKKLLADDGLLILEADRGRALDITAIEPLALVKEKAYKTNKHMFFEWMT